MMEIIGNKQSTGLEARIGFVLDALAASPADSFAALVEVTADGRVSWRASSPMEGDAAWRAWMRECNERCSIKVESLVRGVDLASGSWLDLEPSLRSALENSGRTWVVSSRVSEGCWLLRLGAGLAPDWDRMRQGERPAIEWLAEIVSSVPGEGHEEAAVNPEMDRLRQENAALIRAGQAREEFLARVSHDLRTPLTSILALTELHPDPVEASASGGAAGKTGCMTSIADSCRYQLSLINDLLDLSKSAAGQLKIVCESCDAMAVAAECLRLVRPQAERRRLSLELQSTVGEAWVSADPLRMRQMLMNLLSNAVKFTPAGGAVTLWLARPRANWIAFRVQDTGVGIGPASLTDVFQPFLQVEALPPGASAASGSGLGLAIVKELAEAQKGHVMATSEPGRGSTFVVELPEVPPPAALPRNQIALTAAPQPGAPASTASAGAPSERRDEDGLRVMVVDDHDLNRDLVTDYLTAAGFEVHPFMDGVRALKELPALRPDVVIMDVQMPGLDGLEVTRRIRQFADRGIADVPILGLTALAMPEDRDRCIAAGMNAYQGKPFSLKALPGLLRRLVSDPDGNS